LQLLLAVPDISWNAKIIFIYNKYVSIIVNLYKKQQQLRKKSFRETLSFNDEFATGLLQSIYCHNYFLRGYFPTTPVVVDIGAYIGQFNGFSRHYLRATNIINFESVKICFDTLKLNNIHTNINAAIGPRDCEQEIFIDDRDIFASLVKPKAPMSDRFSSHMVNVLRLDTVQQIADLKCIDFLKIDTERYELKIPLCSPLTMQKSRFILVECSLNRPSSGGVDEVCNYMLDQWPQFRLLDIMNSLRRNNQLKCVEIL